MVLLESRLPYFLALPIPTMRMGHPFSLPEGPPLIWTRRDVVLPRYLAEAIDLYINGSIIVFLKIYIDLLTMLISPGVHKTEDNA